MFVNGTCPGKSWKKDFGVLENPGIWCLQVLESPAKKHFYVCTNTDKKVDRLTHIRKD